MSLSATYDLFLGILLVVLAAFIAVPAWTRWTRNLSLVRKGIKVTGRYQGRLRVAFRLPSGKQVIFSTWRWPVWKCSLGDELPVLYDPDDPSRAEVMKTEALWGRPLSNLTEAVATVVQAILLFRGTNFGIAYLLSLVISLAFYPLSLLALYLCYPASRLHQFRQSRTAPANPKSAVGQPHHTTEQSTPPLHEPAESPHAQRKHAPVRATPDTPRPYLARGRAAREQLLRDMIDIPADLGE